MKLYNEFEPIRKWAYNRGIYQSGDLKTQLVKLNEETGELSRAILKNSKAEISDAIGDCVIVLTNLARLAEQHLCDTCENCRGLGGHFIGEESECNWEECKNCGSLTIEDCINRAYEEIKNRTGSMQNGTFIKDSKNDTSI